jgi:pilus assembly protein CpaF
VKLSDRLNALDVPVRNTPAEAARPARADGDERSRRPLRPVRKATSWEETKRKVRELVLADLAPKLSGPRALRGSALEAEVKLSLDRIVQREEVRISPVERRKFVAEVISDTLGYGPLDGPLHDPTITEIMCNAYDEIWIERRGIIEPTDLAFTDDSQYRQVIDKIVSAVGRRVDEASPMVDARLPDGSRVNAIIPPLALRGPVLTIRKFAHDPYTVRELVEFETLTEGLAATLEACVRGKLNVLISGGTGTGKTTMLNVLSSFIPPKERIVTIEDAAELQLQQPHVVNLEARPSNSEGQGEVLIRDLVRNALRMRPDRIVVGEVRGGEALDMLQAMNTGHEGSLTTVHANSPRDALSRLETMVLMAGYDLPVRAIREQIVSAVHLIVQLDRLADGSRRVSSMQEVQGIEGDTILLQEVFRMHMWVDESGTQHGHVVPTGLRPRFLDGAVGADLPATTFTTPASVRADRERGRPPVSRAALLAQKRKR